VIVACFELRFSSAVTHCAAVHCKQQCVHEGNNQGNKSRVDLALVSQPLADRALSFVLPVRLPQPDEASSTDTTAAAAADADDAAEDTTEPWNIGKWGMSDHSPIWLVLQPPHSASAAAAAASGNSCSSSSSTSAAAAAAAATDAKL
jgi:hypothetical protein